MDHVWKTYKYHPKLLVSIFQVNVIQGHEIKKVKHEIFALGGVMHVFRPVFRQERPKHDITALSKWLPKRTKFEYRKCINPVNGVKSGHFCLENSKTRHF